MTEPDALTNLDAFRAAPLTAPEAQAADVEFDRSLRPANLAEFVGQERTVENLRIALQAARSRGEAPDHILL